MSVTTTKINAQHNIFLRSLLLFGGWAGTWLGDMKVLDVQEIVGPPYFIESLTPVRCKPRRFYYCFC